MVDVTDSLKLVHFIVRRYFNKKLYDEDYYDYVSMGNIGLVKAGNKYDPSRGITFTTFAGRCIINQIRREMRSPLKEDKIEKVSYDNVLKYVLCDDNDTYDKVENRQYLRDLLSKIKTNDTQQKIIDYMLSGDENQVTLAKKIGITQASVSKSLKAIGKKMIAYA